MKNYPYFKYTDYVYFKIELIRNNMLTRISNLKSISADSSVSSNDVRKIIFPTGSLTNNGSGTITLTFSGDGSSFTNLNAGNLASGTLADARLSSNIPLKNAANTFTNANTIAVSSPAIVNLILRGATSQTSDLLQIQDINSNMWIRFLGSSPAIDVAQSNGGVGQGYISLRTNLGINKAGLYRGGLDYFCYYSLATGDIVLDAVYSGSGLSLRIGGNEKVRVTSTGQLLINGFSSGVVGQVIKGAVSQTADLFQTQDSSGNILNSFTASGQQSFYGLSSTTNRRQGFIQSSWKTSTDATRLGQLNFGVTGIIAGSEANQTAISVVAQDCNLTYYVNQYPLTTITSYSKIVVASSTNRDVVQQLKINDGTNDRMTLAHDTAATRFRMYGPNGTQAFTFETSNYSTTIGATSGLTIYVSSGTNTGFQGNNSFLSVCNGDTWYIGQGNDTVRQIIKGMATQSADLLQFQNSSGTVLVSVKSDGSLINFPSVATTGTSGLSWFKSGAFGARLTVDSTTGALLWQDTSSGPAVTKFSISLAGEPGVVGTSIALGATAATAFSFLGNAHNGSSVLDSLIFKTYDNGSGQQARLTITAGGSTTPGTATVRLDNSYLLISSSHEVGYTPLVIQAANGQTATLCQFQGISSTSTVRNLLDIDAVWATSTDATRKSRAILRVWDATASREFIRGESNGTSPMIGFFGASAITQPTASLVTAGYTAGSSTAVTIDGKFTGNTGSTAYTIADIVAALKNLGLLTA